MTDKNNTLDACMGKGQNRYSLVAYAQDSIVSKTILDKPAGTLTLFAFDKGQKLSTHTAPYDAVVQVIDGEALITIDTDDKTLSAGDIIIMPANVPHAVNAKEKFKMLLTMVRA